MIDAFLSRITNYFVAVADANITLPSRTKNIEIILHLFVTFGIIHF